MMQNNSLSMVRVDNECNCGGMYLNIFQSMSLNTRYLPSQRVDTVFEHNKMILSLMFEHIRMTEMGIYLSEVHGITNINYLQSSPQSVWKTTHDPPSVQIYRVQNDKLISS